MEFSQFYLGLMQGLLEGKDLPFFARQLAEQVFMPVIITDAQHHVLASHDHQRVLVLAKDKFTLLGAIEAKDVDLMWTNDLPLMRTHWHADEIRMEGFLLPLAARGRVWGYCYVVSSNDLADQEVQYIREAALVILLALRDLNNWHEEQEQYQTEFIRDILYNNYDSLSAISAKAQVWGWELNGEWALAVGEVDSQKVKLAKELLPGQLMNKRRPLAAIINGQLIVLIPLPGNEKRKNREIINNLLERFASILYQQGLTKVEFAVGSYANSIDYLYKVYQEAKIALELGRSFELSYPFYFSEMGVLKFVFAQPAFELQEFHQRVLGDLYTYDRENDSELVYTLMKYFESRILIPECARLLFIHENTLRNRLKKIEQLTGFDLHRVDHLVNFYVACQIGKIG